MQACYNHLLVHFDASAQACRRLELACRLAPALGAELTALYAVPPSFVEQPFVPDIGASLAAMLVQLDDERCLQARTTFERAVAGAPVAWAEIRHHPVSASFAQQALFADLLVLGQHDPGNAQPPQVGAAFVESVLLQSGRPALVLPYIGTMATLGQTVVIAWKPGREAMRAVAGALPLLQRAAQVHVVGWNSQPLPVGGQALDLAGYLKQRGVQAQWHLHASEPDDVGEALLSRACDLQADLLVMGCYGHSREREWLLGGVSRKVLRSMTLPVLMAH